MTTAARTAAQNAYNQATGLVIAKPATPSSPVVSVNPAPGAAISGPAGNAGVPTTPATTQKIITEQDPYADPAPPAPLNPPANTNNQPGSSPAIVPNTPINRGTVPPLNSAAPNGADPGFATAQEDITPMSEDQIYAYYAGKSAADIAAITDAANSAE